MTALMKFTTVSSPPILAYVFGAPGLKFAAQTSHPDEILTRKNSCNLLNQSASMLLDIDRVTSMINLAKRNRKGSPNAEKMGDALVIAEIAAAC
jgi:hypothetical protein